MKAMILAAGACIALAHEGHPVEERRRTDSQQAKECSERKWRLGCRLAGCEWDSETRVCQPQVTVPAGPTEAPTPSPTDGPSLCNLAPDFQTCLLLLPLGCTWQDNMCGGEIEIDGTEVCPQLTTEPLCLILTPLGCGWKDDSCVFGEDGAGGNGDNTDDGSGGETPDVPDIPIPDVDVTDLCIFAQEEAQCQKLALIGCTWEEDSCVAPGESNGSAPTRRLGFLLNVLGTANEMDDRALTEIVESLDQAFDNESMDINSIIQIVIKILQLFLGGMERGSLTADDITRIIEMIIEILSTFF